MDYSDKELWKYRNYKYADEFKDQMKDPLEIELTFGKRYNWGWYFYGFRLKEKWYYLDKNVLLAKDYRYGEFYCNDKEILTGKKLQKFKETVQSMLYQTFTRTTRTFQIPEQSRFGRCLYCSRKLPGQIRKPKKCCYKDKDGKVTNCSYYFFRSYHWGTLAQYIAKRDNYTCQICKKEDLQEWDIDHIIEIASVENNIESAKLFMDQSNLQVLCRECHKKKTAKFLSERFTKTINVKSKSKSKQLMDYI